MAECRSTTIPAFAVVSAAVLAVIAAAIALRVSRPVHLDDVFRRAGLADVFADEVDTRLDINRATAGELSLLPGVGPRLAQRIVDHRAAHGLFRSIDDLQRVTGIGERTIARMHAFVVADPDNVGDPSTSIARASGDPGG